MGNNGVKESQLRPVLSFYALRRFDKANVPFHRAEQLPHFGPHEITPARLRPHQFIPRNQRILARPKPLAASALQLAVQFLCFQSGLMGFGYLHWPAAPFS